MTCVVPTEYKRGTLMQDRRADDGADAHANFCGVLAPVVAALADGATALGALVARHAVAPSASLYVPGAHGRHVARSGEYEPAGHVAQ